jgi:hypothetical protein
MDQKNGNGKAAKCGAQTMIDWSEGLRDLTTFVGVAQKIFETAVTRHSKSLCKQVKAGVHPLRSKT